MTGDVNIREVGDAREDLDCEIELGRERDRHVIGKRPASGCHLKRGSDEVGHAEGCTGRLRVCKAPLFQRGRVRPADTETGRRKQSNDHHESERPRPVTWRTLLDSKWTVQKHHACVEIVATAHPARQPTPATSRRLRDARFWPRLLRESASDKSEAA